jgi:trigger factor
MSAHGIVATPVQDALTTTVSELPESRVRVEVQIKPEEIEGRIERQARQLGQRLKMPGFRRGKVPAPLVIQRVGRETVFEEAVRSSLGGWYASAIEAAGIVPVGDPSVELGEAPSQGEPFRFSIEVGVLPKARLGQYKGLEVARAEPVVTEQSIDEEVQRLRERLARLEDVDARAERGDFVVIDYSASADDRPLPGGQARDQLIELGNGALLPSLEHGLVGVGAGEQRAIAVTFPDDYPNTDLAGRSASFDVTAKRVKRKQLPEVDEDFAADTGFDSIADLREDIARRLRAVEEERADREFREAALDEAARQADVTVPPALVEARAKEVWERMLRALERQGISREAYLKIGARREDELLDELAPAAEQALRREAVLTAVVQAEGVSTEDSELLELLGATGSADQAAADAGHEHHDHDHDHDHAHGHDHGQHGRHREHAGGESAPDAAKLMAELRRSGRLEELREELAARKAIDLIAAEAKPIAQGRASARAKLWTPEKELDEVAPGDRASRGGAHPATVASARKKRLWTPGSSG